jgi:uncharacterized lipoprotein YajG
MKSLKILAVLALTALSAACSTTAVPLTYQPSDQAATAAKGPAVVSVVSVIDNRKVDPKWLGAIRGGYGNALKTLELERPVGDVVRDVVVAGLAARGLAATETPKFQMTIAVNKFDCSQLVRREAHAVFEVTVVDVSGAHRPFTKVVASNLVRGDLIALDTGVFASIEDLRKIANDALQDAVDQLLDDPTFRSSLT